MKTMKLKYRPLAVVSLTVSLLIWSRMTSAKDVFASSAHLKMLADGERDLVASLRQYIDLEHNRLDQIDDLLLEVRAVHSSYSQTSPLVTSGDRLTANPIQAFHLIKRFATTWRYIWALASNFTAYEGMKITSERLSEHLPVDSDVTSTMLSLIRLRKTYDLPITDLMRGHVAGYQAPPIDHTHAFDFALMCLGNGEPDEAIKWLTYAYDIATGNYVGIDEPEMVSLSIIYQAFGRAYGQKGDYMTALDYIRKAVELEPTNGGFLVDILPPSNLQLTVTTEEPEWRRNYLRLCREAAYSDQHSTTASVDTSARDTSRDQHLHCRLQQSRISPFQRNKVEFLHRSPDVVLFHDIVSDAESEKLKKMAVAKIVRARIGSSMETVESEARVGKIAWLYDDVDDVLVRKISRRVGDVTGLNVTFPSSEPLQNCILPTSLKIPWGSPASVDALSGNIANDDSCQDNQTFYEPRMHIGWKCFTEQPRIVMSNYGLGGHYEPHYDHDEHRFERDQQPQEVIDNGDRIATLMIYLNEVTVGGATVFTKLNLALKPVKLYLKVNDEKQLTESNAAVFWYNYKASGDMDPLALHAACPVLIGEKWVANKWIREFGQEFSRPCALDQETPSRHHVTVTSFDR